MAWDISQNLQTGDWEWDAKRDLASADGLALVQQRIHRRLAIERDSYIYDREGSLGSRLQSLLRMGVPAASGGIEMIIREALEPMDDVVVKNVEVYTYNDGSNAVTSPSNVLARINYEIRVSNVDLVSETSGQLSADITIPLA